MALLILLVETHIGIFAAKTPSSCVGYGPTGLAESGNGVCGGPQFISVSGGAIDLIDITVTGYTPYDPSIPGSGSEGEVTVQSWTGAGGRIREYQWFNDSEGSAWFRTDDGSYDELAKGDMTIDPGRGLWVISTVPGRFIQTSGSVQTALDITTPLANSGNGVVTANPTPVNVDLIDCYVTGYTPYDPAVPGSGSEGEVTVQTLTGAGGRIREYQWFNDSEGSAWFRTDDASYDELQRGDVVRVPGEGLWTISTVENRNFVWPKVTLP